MLLTKQVRIKWNGHVRNHYEQRGYVFTKNNDFFIANIEDVQEGSSVSVDVQCDECGAISTIIYSSYTKKKKDPSYERDLCRSCSQKGKTPHNKFSIDVIRKGFEERGYTLISTEYEGSNKKLLFTCPKHIDKGPLEITWNSLQSGHGCKYCGQERYKKYSSYVYRNVQEIGSHLKNSVEQWLKDSQETSQSTCYVTGVPCQYVQRLFDVDEVIEEAFASLDIKKKEIVYEYSKLELQKLEEKVLELHYQRGLGVCLSKEAFDLYRSAYQTNQVTHSQLDEFKERYLAGEFSQANRKQA
jgi:hypothetical protein